MRYSLFSLRVLWVPIACLLISRVVMADGILEPGRNAIGAPASGTAFSDYLTDTRQRIQASLVAAPSPHGFLGNYDAATAARMRAPFELAPVEACQQPASETVDQTGVGNGAGKGFLLIHGLTDSPYTLRNIADDLHAAYPCALIRSIILPGHGTVPGDTLTMTHEQWRAAVRYGVGSFATDSIQQLYLAGFSTGTSLIIDYLNQSNPNPDTRVAGVILLSTAVKAGNPMAFLSPVARHVKSWMTERQERDAARYESFSLNAGAEFYLLTEGMKQPAKALDVPMLMAVTADDTTVNAAAAREFFCYPGKSERKLLLWYESADKDLNARQAQQPELQCDGIVSVSPASFDPRWQTLNVSHVGISNSPEDSHYGLKGNYRHCRGYDDGTEDGSEDFNRCQADDTSALFGENQTLLEQQGLLGERYFRRGTFNPDYDNLISRIICFADEQCEMKAR